MKMRWCNLRRYSANGLLLVLLENVKDETPCALFPTPAHSIICSKQIHHIFIKEKITHGKKERGHPGH
jgi:hypothetical protein